MLLVLQAGASLEARRKIAAQVATTLASSPDETSELDAAKKGAAINGAKLKVLEAQSQVHRTAAPALETKQKQLNDGKQDAAVEQLQDEIRKMSL